jgi:hypothetical protein
MSCPPIFNRSTTLSGDGYESRIGLDCDHIEHRPSDRFGSNHERVNNHGYR